MTDLTVVKHCIEMQQLYAITSICYYLTTCRIKKERVVLSKSFFSKNCLFLNLVTLIYCSINVHIFTI